ncbi:MAG: hypothetical protein L3K26_06165 [Candidatus Hydrogenedentes bacterium]|nr:hypothetical protein [Candidatus Hydrogenedentota bacterium]
MKSDKNITNPSSELKKGDPAYYKSLTEAQLDEIWTNRVSLGLTDPEQRLLRGILRDKKGFKPVEVNVSICQRCNLPADNCACLNL